MFRVILVNCNFYKSTEVKLHRDILQPFKPKQVLFAMLQFYFRLRLVFRWVFYIHENLGNFKEKPTRKTCFSDMCVCVCVCVCVYVCVCVCVCV